ncbi:MAG: putative acyl-CoA dehydrogenase [Alphaproteobacteria bacterium]|jgi:putative acyl-CoA dehydrogenase|nr:putative acyl-CoA dehydrogenase [Alphaproteobacteria bacterium]
MATRLDNDVVFNQSPPYEDVDLFGSDVPLREAVAANGAGSGASELAQFGRRWGSAGMFEQARLANENPPKLRAFDAKGRRRDFVEFHPAYHHFMAESVRAGLHASTWRPDGTPAAAPAEVARAARFYMVAQVENGHMCPITMTRASVAALAAAPELRAGLTAKILSRDYDPGFRPWPEKSGMTLGMGMTEKQGGTDVRANITRSERDGDAYRITGHKWFMSAPMCDAFLVLAQAAGGLTCFFLPRFRPDGTVNALHFQRLKNKLGNRSNASSEVEFDDAHALRVGEEGGGVRTILPMVQLTRLDCAISSAGMMRGGLAQALHHCRHRCVFGKPLSTQPMMRAVLADMAIEVEGALAAVMRLCRSFDLASSVPSEAARARLLTAAIKYWVCKTAPALVYEAMECLGGNGYVEDGTLARLYRETPVNAIWEGSGNVMGLDVLRAFARDAAAARATLAELAREADDLPGAADAVGMIERTFADAASEANARIAVERLAQLAAAAALQASAPAAVTAAFARTRLSGRGGATYGTSDLAAETTSLLARVMPDF